MRQPAGATRRQREDVTTRRRDNERAAHREAKQHTAGATRGQEGGARSDLVSSKTTTRTTADRDTRVWDPTQRRVGGCIDQRTAGTGFGIIGRAVRVGLMLFGYKQWGREQRHRGTDDDERGCRRGRGGLGGMGPGGGGVRRTPPSYGNGGGRANRHIITPPSPSSSPSPSPSPSLSSSATTILVSLVIKDEDQCKKMLDAIRSIVTGRPRPGHTVVGAGTYRMG